MIHNKREMCWIEIVSARLVDVRHFCNGLKGLKYDQVIYFVQKKHWSEDFVIFLWGELYIELRYKALIFCYPYFFVHSFSPIILNAIVFFYILQWYFCKLQLPKVVATDMICFLMYLIDSSFFERERESRLLLREYFNLTNMSCIYIFY